MFNNLEIDSEISMLSFDTTEGKAYIEWRYDYNGYLELQHPRLEISDIKLTSDIDQLLYFAAVDAGWYVPSDYNNLGMIIEKFYRELEDEIYQREREFCRD